jgi:hypothetical protein
MGTWVIHFAKVLSNKGTRPVNMGKGEVCNKENIRLFTQQEAEAINSAKNRKAAGPGEINNEHLKVAQPLLLETWTDNFNNSQEKGISPEPWRLSTMVLYKGKGNVSSPDSYWGIALECTLFKIFMRLITKRLTKLVDSQIPDEQFGFRHGRPMIHAVTKLLNNTEEVLRWPGENLFVAFVDFSKAFDILNRNMTKVNDFMGQRHPVTRVIRNILPNNSVHINYSISMSMEIPQTSGLTGRPTASTAVRHSNNTQSAQYRRKTKTCRNIH